MAGYLLKINILIYETNSILGRTNKFFYFLSKKLLLGYDNQKLFTKEISKKINICWTTIEKIFHRKKETRLIFSILIKMNLPF